LRWIAVPRTSTLRNPNLSALPCSTVEPSVTVVSQVYRVGRSSPHNSNPPAATPLATRASAVPLAGTVTVTAGAPHG
jgi:hypothetical protein